MQGASDFGLTVEFDSSMRVGSGTDFDFDMGFDLDSDMGFDLDSDFGINLRFDFDSELDYNFGVKVQRMLQSTSRTAVLE